MNKLDLFIFNFLKYLVQKKENFSKEVYEAYLERYDIEALDENSYIHLESALEKIDMKSVQLVDEIDGDLIENYILSEEKRELFTQNQHSSNDFINEIIKKNKKI